MAMIVEGESTCPLCAKVIEKGQKVTGFPAFLPPMHEFAQFSDAAFHRTCFESDPRALVVHDLYARYCRVWRKRPRKLKTLSEVEDWQRAALARLWDEDDFRPLPDGM